MRTSKSEIEKSWRRHVELITQYPGTLKDYCQSNGISISAYHYWRNKLNPRTRTTRRAVKQPAFIPVQVIEPRIERIHPELPDPRWVAELIRCLAGGSR
jgi:hypothetical protein